VDAISQVLDRAHEIRGKYLDRMCAVEWEIDELLTSFYGISSKRQLAFKAGILRRMPMSAKIGNTRAILQQASVLSQYRSLEADLKAANELRNALAHSGAWSGPDTLTDDMIYLAGTKNGLPVMRGYRVSDLEKSLESLEELAAEVRRCKEALPSSEASLTPVEGTIVAEASI
jgi:hypothetical protein